MQKVDSYTETELDEDATAEQTAERNFCITVERPAQERWLELALVIEESNSTFLWQETVRDLKRVLEHQGAFRSLTVWYLQTTGDSSRLLSHAPQMASEQPSRSPRELVAASGRRLILLVSDCISAAWRQGEIQERFLSVWAEQNPVAIVQLLPDHLWSRTALSLGLEVQLGSPNRGVPNHRLQFQEWPIGSETQLGLGLKLPVVTLEPDAVKQWAQMMVGNRWTPGIWFDPAWADAPPEPVVLSPELSAMQRVQRFLTTASRPAQQLAGYMALVPVSLPIIYLIQETMLPQSTALHVAEVFMSGLIKRVASDSDPATTRVRNYDFIAEVRPPLIHSLSKSEAEQVLDRVSQFIGEKQGRKIYTFTALLMLEQELGGIAGTEFQKFATITRQAVQQLGGQYARFAQQAEQRYQDYQHREFLRRLDLSGFPPIEDFSYTVPYLDLEPPPEDNWGFVLETQSLDVATVTVEDVPEDIPAESDESLEPFPIRIATVERRGGDWTVAYREDHAYRYIEPLPDEVALEMVAIPAGEFVMGSPPDEPQRYDDDEGPQHSVQVSRFFMGRYPITQAQWRVVAALPSMEQDLNPDPARFKGNTRPVEQVSWNDAVEFCQRLSRHTGRPYRLPTEAEWEYACRAGTTTPFHFGETMTTDLANYNGNYTFGNGPKGEYRQETTPVDHFGVANPFGLCDMHGNVWEWCLDTWHENYEGAPTDGSAWIEDGNSNTWRLLRGGSWSLIPRYCRSASRIRNFAAFRLNFYGLRVVCRPPRTL
jgi:formylglycine-generating enzyme required for sulfatase activity